MQYNNTVQSKYGGHVDVSGNACVGSALKASTHLISLRNKRAPSPPKFQKQAIFQISYKKIKIKKFHKFIPIE